MPTCHNCEEECCDFTFCGCPCHSWNRDDLDGPEDHDPPDVRNPYALPFDDALAIRLRQRDEQTR